MQTTIHSSDFALTDALESFTKQQVQQSMKKCSDKVEGLVIRLKSINGPQREKECVVEVKLAQHAPVVVSKRSGDAYASIRAALSRASRTTLRRVSKRRLKRGEMSVQENDS